MYSKPSLHRWQIHPCKNLISLTLSKITFPRNPGPIKYPILSSSMSHLGPQEHIKNPKNQPLIYLTAFKGLRTFLCVFAQRLFSQKLGGISNGADTALYQ